MGGTVLAGDVGTAWSDEYGLKTAVGTGERVARVTKSLESSSSYKLTDKVRIGVWIMQDSTDKKGLVYVKRMIESVNRDDTEFDVIDMTDEEIARCIACDLCPTHHAPRDEYACIIGSKSDLLVKEHARLVNVDAILLMAYSPINRSDIKSVYQRFIERTRYIRRAHYALSERLAAPFVISEINANQNLHIRMLTSLVRHHTVLHHPVIGLEKNGEIVNYDYCVKQFNEFVSNSKIITASRLLRESSEIDTSYNPIGYTISRVRNQTDHESGKLRELFTNEKDRHVAEQTSRLVKES